MNRPDRPAQKMSETQERCCRKSKTRDGQADIVQLIIARYRNSPPPSTHPLPQACRILPRPSRVDFCPTSESRHAGENPGGAEGIETHGLSSAGALLGRAMFRKLRESTSPPARTQCRFRRPIHSEARVLAPMRRTYEETRLPILSPA